MYIYIYMYTYIHICRIPQVSPTLPAPRARPQRNTQHVYILVWQPRQPAPPKRRLSKPTIIYIYIYIHTYYTNVSLLVSLP